MRKKSFLFLILAVTLSITTSGCVDLFQVPGVAISPDGSRIYFLESPAPTTGDEESSTSSGNLVSAPLGGGIDTLILPSVESEGATAFGVNPVTGEIAFVKYTEANGSSVEIYNPADASTRILVGPEAFGNFVLGTMLQYSPDGTQLAFTAFTLPPDVALEDLDAEDSELTDEQLAAIKFKAYIVNASDGTLTEIVATPEAAFNTLDWNQSGTQIALNGWSDNNGDGRIIVFPDSESEEFSDLTQVYLYDVAANSTTQLTSSGINFAPTYAGDSLLWIGFDIANEMAVIQNESGTLYSSPNQVTGLAVSPDGTQVAWVESQSDTESEENLPGLLYVAGEDFASPRLVAELPNILLPDVPVWLPDSQSVLVTSTSLLAALVTGFTASFDMSFGTESTPEVEVEDNSLSIPSVVQVNLQSGEVMPVYSGTILNSSVYSGLIGLIASGVLEDLFADMGMTEE